MYMDISKKYNVIYADPPWSFKTFSDKGKDRSPENHYNVMTLQDIKELPVNQIADDNSVLLMWVVDPLLDKALSGGLFIVNLIVSPLEISSSNVNFNMTL